MKSSMILLLLALSSLLAQTSSSCMLGSELAPTSPFPELGHYLDLDRPATCSGQLTAWHICYYTSPEASLSLSITLRVWRPTRGNRYERISGQVLTFIHRSTQNVTVCETIDLVSGSNEIEIQEGDIYAANIQSGPRFANILASLPPGSGRRLYRDESFFSFGDLRRNDLELVDDVGMHVYADIRTEDQTTEDKIAESSSPTTTEDKTAEASSPTTTEDKTAEASSPTKTAEASSPTTTEDKTAEASSLTTTEDKTAEASSPTTTKSTTTKQIMDQLGSAPNAEQQLGNEPNPGRTAGIVIAVVILVAATITVLLAVCIVCFKKRKLIFVKCCGEKGLGSMDNALYRLGSQRIRPLFSKTSSTKDIVNDYDIANEKKAATPHREVETPEKNGTPQPLNHQSYDVPRPMADRSTYSIPSNLPVASNGYDNHKIETQIIIEPEVDIDDDPRHAVYKVPTSSNGMLMATPEQQQGGDSGDYIFMNNPPDVENEFVDEDCVGPEEYQDTFGYDSVQYRSLLEQATTTPLGEDSPYKAPPSREDEIYVVLSQQKIKVIPRQTITITGVIGSGHFGKVDRGTWKSIKKDTMLDVALKTISSDSSAEDKIKLLQEAIIMGQFTHPNIVQLYGIVSRGDPLILVMEYMPKGDLKKYLLNLKPQKGQPIDSDVPNLLLSFSQQVALGMHYLAGKGLVHRDLAARNILISQDKTCKIGDFGLARNMSGNGYYLGSDGKVPLKWMAPEAISLKKYSTASDVWSYGCLLYEVWSLGAQPFKGIKNNEAIIKINSGYRLPPPPGCPKEIYRLMIQCWNPVSSARPKYQAILTSLLEDPKKVLHIPLADTSSHSQACLLGSPLVAGSKMYSELQTSYILDASDKHDPDYEYMDTDSDHSQENQ